MNALSPSLIAPPPFPPSPPGVPSLPLAVEERRGQHDLLGHRNSDGLTRSCCARCPLFGTGSPEMSSSKFLGSSSGTAVLWRRWASSSRVMVEEPFPERRRRGQVWCLTLNTNNELLCLHLQVFVLVWAWSWYVDYLGHQSGNKPGPYLSVLQSYWNLHVESDGSVVPLVSRYLGLSIVFTSDLEYFALLSSVGCIGTLLVSVVSGRTGLPLNLLRLPGSSSGASRSLPLSGQYPSGNHELRRLLNRSENDNLWVL